MLLSLVLDLCGSVLRVVICKWTMTNGSEPIGFWYEFGNDGGCRASFFIVAVW